jgi:hypothetical protein
MNNNNPTERFPTPSEMIRSAQKAVKDMRRLTCCLAPCDQPAAYQIIGESNHPDDMTEACVDHVGALLGTPDWLQVDNRAWTVVLLGWFR